MIKKIILFGCLLHWGISLSYGQESQKAQKIQAGLIEGIVIDSTIKQPVIFATVKVKNNTKTGAITDVNGKFKIHASVGDILQVSCIGFISKDFKIENTRSIEIGIKTDIHQLKEIAVVGYGTQQRKDLTGSISTLKSNNIDKSILSFDNAMNGK